MNIQREFVQLLIIYLTKAGRNIIPKLTSLGEAKGNKIMSLYVKTLILASTFYPIIYNNLTI